MQDPVGQGRVQILPAGETPIMQAQVVMAELQRLANQATDWSWSNCTVIAREWRYLNPIRSLCELEGIPVQMANEDVSSTWLLRETQSLLKWLQERDTASVRYNDIAEWFSRQRSNEWTELIGQAAAEFELEFGDRHAPVDHFREWLAEWSRDVQRRQQGLLLLTAHRAKGLEFNHVALLDGGWNRVGRDDDPDTARRLYYVAMTRARQTLSLATMGAQHPFLAELRRSPSTIEREPSANLAPAPRELSHVYRRLSLREVVLGFAGRQSSGHPIHRALSQLSTGDELSLKRDAYRWHLLNRQGVVVGQLARTFKPPKDARCISASVSAIATWSRERTDPQYQSGIRCKSWEVVVPELIFAPR